MKTPKTIRNTLKGSVRLAVALCVVFSLSGCLTTNSKTAGAERDIPVYKYGLYGGADSAGMHTVSGNDTLWSISEHYKLSMQDIIQANGLEPPYQLRKGQRLRLPPPAEYTVRQNDTLYGISRTFSVSITEIARLNGMHTPYALEIGQNLRLPSAKPPVRLASLSSNAPSYGAPGATGKPVALSSPRIQPVEKAALPDVSPNDTGGKKLAWPVNGMILSNFGPRVDGIHNDGINIRAVKGSPVRAADGGTVVYSGNQIKGFGNLVLIKHQDRLMTAYAHMDTITVQRGAEVRQGDMIGTVGDTGGVGAPQLHFEVRRGTEAVDPQEFLGTQGI